MPKVSWNKATKVADSPETAAAVSSENETTTAIATVPNPGSLAPVPARGVGEEGEWDPSMDKKPYLALFSNKSDNADEFPEWIGTWVIDKQVSLGKEFVFIPVFLKNWFEEETEFGSGDIPERWATSAEARASGKAFRTVGELQMLIEIPAAKLADEAVLRYSVELAGKLYVPVKYTTRKSSFTEVYQTVRTDKSRWLKGHYPSGQYRMTVKKVTGKFTYLAPQLRAAGPTPEDVRAAIQDQFGV